MGLKITIQDNLTQALANKLAAASKKAEHEVALRIATDTEPFVPFLTGSLLKRTRVDGGYIIYPGPYAHYLYYGKVWIDPKINAAGFMTDDGWKSRFGSKKIETNRNLVFTKSFHQQAQSHWFEASKAQNLEKWEKVAEEAVESELKK